MELSRCKKILIFLTAIILWAYFHTATAQIPLKGIYLGIEGGYSFSNNVNFSPQQSDDCIEIEGQQGCWLNTHQSFSRTIDNSPVFGAKVGYHLNSLLSIDVAYNQRNAFYWSKDFPGDFSGAVNTSPAPRNRTINTIQNKTLITNFNLTPPVTWLCLHPYLNAGIGFAWNSLSDLKSINLNNGNRAIITGGSNTTFAWQLGAGFNIPINKNWFFNAGYRYLDMGKFRSGTRDIFANVNQPIAPLQANHAFTNEIYAGLNYNL